MARPLHAQGHPPRGDTPRVHGCSTSQPNVESRSIDEEYLHGSEKSPMFLEECAAVACRRQSGRGPAARARVGGDRDESSLLRRLGRIRSKPAAKRRRPTPRYKWDDGSRGRGGDPEAKRSPSASSSPSAWPIPSHRGRSRLFPSRTPGPMKSSNPTGHGSTPPSSSTTTPTARSSAASPTTIDSSAPSWPAISSPSRSSTRCR